MEMDDLIKEFMEQKRFAVVGATDNPEKYGNRVYHNLRHRNYEVYPVNPRLETLDGEKCYASLTELPVKVDVVDFVVPPAATEAILKECLELGLENIWLQPGSESQAALDFCREHNLKVVHDVCVMMN
jgi:predicted CoA-binding protein